MKKRIVFITSLIFILISLLAWQYSKKLDVSGQTTTLIKNDKGQPCALWWWKPSEDPTAVLYSEQMGGEWYSVWNSAWMVDHWFLVAEVGIPRQDARNSEDGIKVYLIFSPPSNTSSGDRMFVAERKDLTKKRSWWP